MADLELRDLSKSFDDVAAVDQVNLTVEAGEMVTLLGPSGCGKTTTLRMIAGFVTPSSGSILVRGRDITYEPPHRREMGMVFQSYALFPHMTVHRNVAFGLRAHRAPKPEVAERVRAALELVGLEGFADRYPRQLSGGQQQRVAVARVLALKPKLLLFDEPLSNLDAKLRVQMRHEIRRLQKEVGITALFVTHDQDEAMTIADRIVVINEGRIEQIGDQAEIYDQPRTRFVADFIGKTNFLEGRIVNGAFRSRSGLEIPLPMDSDGERDLVLSIRPEKIDLEVPPAQDALRGEIMRAIKLGGFYEYDIALPTGEMLVVQEQGRTGVERREPGSVAGLSWRPEDVRLLPA